MSHEVYVHYLHGGPSDGDHVPNKRPWEELVITNSCKVHEKGVEFEEMEKCPDCKRHKYVKVEPTEFKEADCPGLEVITADGEVDQAPIIHRIEMNYVGPAI